jgi:ABC-2 type transport system permease protein
MTAHRTLATVARVLRQLRHDPRTIVLLLGVPCLLLWLIAWMFEGTPTLDHLGPLLLGVFPLVVMFLVTSVATLRERQTGTLERLMASPLGKADLILGYGLAFGLVAIVQGTIVTTFAVSVLGMKEPGPLWSIILIAALNALLGTALGLAASAFARTEFQAVQMMPAFIFPQLIVGGLLMPRDQMPAALEGISRVMPLTYGIQAMRDLMATRGDTAQIWSSVALIAVFIVAAIVLASLTLRRRTP